MKKKILSFIFFFLIISLTIYSVFNGQDINEIIKDIKGTNPLYISLGVVSVIVFIYAESFIIRRLLKRTNIKKGRIECFVYSSIGFFVSAITPSASGGQPAQMVYMKKKDVPVAVAGPVLLIVTILYKLVLVIIGTLIIVLNIDVVDYYLKDSAYIFYIGYMLNVVFVLGLIAFITMNNIVRKIFRFIARILNKCHIVRNIDKAYSKIDNFSDRYKLSVKNLCGLGALLEAFVATLIQRFALFLVTWFVYKSFGLTGHTMYEIVLVQAMISIAVDMLPLPGGSGITEYLFGLAFVAIFGEYLLAGLVLSRGIAYYVQLVFCMIVTAVANFVTFLSRKNKKTTDDLV